MDTGPSPTSGGTSHLLPQERAQCSFDIGLLRKILTGSAKHTATGFEHLFEGPPFNDTDEDAFRGYLELYEKRHERAAAAMKVVQDNSKFRAAHQSQRVPMGTFIAGAGISIHFSMFLTFLRTQASKEQQERWLGPALSGGFLGAYAQTELGHGSNIRALETTATFDKVTDEFVVDSPTLTSMKWWPTGIYACTHACVMAQLIIDGVNYGFHGFMVQLRDDKGYCMPGIEIGEIGPKFDPEHNYIGYARFNRVRIPRFNLFAKNQQLTRDGKYIAAPPKLSKFKYISMMSTRVTFVHMSASSLGKAATIAIRYSAVRHQGFKDTQAQDPIASGELRIIDYRMQQYRTFKALALTYMFSMSARWVGSYLSRVQAAVSAGDESAADELPELHASCAGLKVWATLMAHDAMEDMRRSAGGQGFLRSSALGDLVAEFGVAVTGEGEQVILSMQVARFVIKSVQEWKMKKPLAGTVQYLEDPPLCKVDIAQSAQKPDLLVALFKDRARRFAVDLESRFAGAQAEGKTFDEALNSVAVLAYKTAEVHCVYVLARNFELAISKYIEDPAAAAAVRRLQELAFLQLLREQGADWAEALDYHQQGLVLDRIHALLDEIRPDCIGLVDALGHSDKALKNSTLGRYDGNVYEAIYDRAKLSPLNKAGSKMVGWDHFAKVLDLDFIREGMKTQRTQADILTSEASILAPPTSGHVSPSSAASRAKL